MGTNSNKLEQTSPFILNTALAAVANRFRCSKKNTPAIRQGPALICYKIILPVFENLLVFEYDIPRFKKDNLV